MTPEGLLCTSTHEWIIEENNIISVGLTDYQAQKAGDIVFVELPEIGSIFSKNEVFATIESVKSALELHMPISGKVIEINEKLINSPELINENAFESWFIKVEPSDYIDDSQDLMEYNDYMEELD